MCPEMFMGIRKFIWHFMHAHYGYVGTIPKYTGVETGPEKWGGSHALKH